MFSHFKDAFGALGIHMGVKDAFSTFSAPLAIRVLYSAHNDDTLCHH